MVKEIKIFAIAAAVMMLAVAGIAVIGFDESEATSTGSVKVYYYDANNSQWGSASVTAYNLYIAVSSAATTLNYTVTTDHATWKSGNNPDKDYGLVTSVNNNANYKIYGYNNQDQAWNDITNYPLGWFKPYADYVAVNVDGHYAAYANVAIVTKNAQGEYYDYTTITEMIGLTSVQSSSNMYTFTLKDDTASVEVPEGTTVKMLSGSTYTYQPLTTQMLRSGVTVYGFGSDAYLALLDAVGSSLVGQMTAYVAHTGYYTYYSWMISLFGKETVTLMEGGNIIGYQYWELKYGETWANWTLGYYSIEHPDTEQNKSTFSLIYVESLN